MYDDIDIPEPPTLFDDYSNRSNAAKNAEMRVAGHMLPKDYKDEIPENLKGDEKTRWLYQQYIKDYLRCVASVDDNIGKMLDFLDEEGLSENTIVIYTSDQGFFLGDHGWYDKRFMYEESLRMPFVIRYPREIEAGSHCQNIVTNLDFAKTFLDYAAIEAPGEMQGRSFRPILNGETPDDWPTSMYYRYWMHMQGHAVPAHYGIRTQRYKLIYYYGKPCGMNGVSQIETEPEWELFDLEKDPQEMNSVYGNPEYAEIQKDLEAELARLKKEAKDIG